mmetsp:Transcript_46222/g.110163  ORF Transcript_46222/g.110163 Transcript_46222/m.110163 type:complete len:302 (+) Transcript_46222:780-1685(+)
MASRRPKRRPRETLHRSRPLRLPLNGGRGDARRGARPPRSELFPDGRVSERHAGHGNFFRAVEVALDQADVLEGERDDVLERQPANHGWLALHVVGVRPVDHLVDLRHQVSELSLQHLQLMQVERRHRRRALHLFPDFAVWGDHPRLEFPVVPKLCSLQREQPRNRGRNGAVAGALRNRNARLIQELLDRLGRSGRHLLHKLSEGFCRSVPEEIAGPLVAIIDRLADEDRVDSLELPRGFHDAVLARVDHRVHDLQLFRNVVRAVHSPPGERHHGFEKPRADQREGHQRLEEPLGEAFLPV